MFIIHLIILYYKNAFFINHYINYLIYVIY